MTAPSTTKTRLERHFDPEAVQALKKDASRDLLIGGPNLAAQALAAGIVDDVELYIWPSVLGGRNPALPSNVSAELELIDEHRFNYGIVRLRYRVV